MWVSFYLGNHFSLNLSSLEITGLYLFVKSFPKIPNNMIVFVNITKPRVTWEKNVSEGLPALRWFVRRSMGHCLNEPMWEDPVHCRQRHSLSGWSWTAVEWGNWLTYKQVGMPAFLPAPLWVRCRQRLHATVTVASPQWWMEFRLWAVINPFPTQLLTARVTYHSNGNGSGTHRKSYSCFLRFLYFLLLLEKPAY